MLDQAEDTGHWGRNGTLRSIQRNAHTRTMPQRYQLTRITAQRESCVAPCTAVKDLNLRFAICLTHTSIAPCWCVTVIEGVAYHTMQAVSGCLDQLDTAFYTWAICRSHAYAFHCWKTEQAARKSSHTT